MDDIMQFQTLVRKSRVENLSKSFIWILLFSIFVILFLLIHNFENAGALDFLKWLVFLIFLLIMGYLYFETIKELPRKKQNDKILNSTDKIESISKIILWTGGKEGRFDVTFLFVDGSEEGIRFYNPMINLILPRIFGDKVVIKSRYE